VTAAAGVGERHDGLGRAPGRCGAAGQTGRQLDDDRVELGAVGSGVALMVASGSDVTPHHRVLAECLGGPADDIYRHAVGCRVAKAVVVLQVMRRLQVI